MTRGRRTIRTVRIATLLAVAVTAGGCVTSARSRYELHLTARVPKGGVVSPEFARAFGLDDARESALGAFGDPVGRP